MNTCSLSRSEKTAKSILYSSNGNNCSFELCQNSRFIFINIIKKIVGCKGQYIEGPDMQCHFC